MYSKLYSYTSVGIEGELITVETDIGNGLPSVDTVGLASTEVKESKERVYSAIRHSGFSYPTGKITVSLSPGDLKKSGTLFDLPIAVGTLLASGEILDKRSLNGYILLGELALDGALRGVRGVLPLIIAASKQGYNRFIIPVDNAIEAQYVQNVTVYPARTLREVAIFVGGENNLTCATHREYVAANTPAEFDADFSEIRGQLPAKRGVEIAVAGGHNILMVGPQGTGKSMLAKAVPSIMPDLSFGEALEVTKIWSIAGLLDSAHGIVNARPFRSPHHTTTAVTLIGGGRDSRPGEVSLAHHGVLFLDEFPEYSRTAIEALRQPIEDGRVHVSRLMQSLTYPAEFMLIASMNPCPCGFYGSKTEPCRCTPNQIRLYRAKLSGPMLDRIDIKVEVDNIPYKELRGQDVVESSAAVKRRIEDARAIQAERYAGEGIYTNARMTNRHIKAFCILNTESEKLLEAAYKRLNMSARGMTRILKVARTIADLVGSESIASEHVGEALRYCTLTDRN